MKRIDALNARYASVKSSVRYGVEIVAVGDPPGARLNGCGRQLLRAVLNDGPDIWDDLLGAVKALRWLRVTQAAARTTQPGDAGQCSAGTAWRVKRLRGAVASEALLDEVGAAAVAVGRIRLSGRLGVATFHRGDRRWLMRSGRRETSRRKPPWSAGSRSMAPW